MRLQTLLAAVAATALVATAAVAQQQGQYSAALTRMLAEASEGRCAEDVMAAPLLAACQAQIAQMAPGLRSLGAVESVTFVKAEETPQGLVETYAVKFAGGQTMDWIIGQMSEGKFSAAGTAG